MIPVTNSNFSIDHQRGTNPIINNDVSPNIVYELLVISLKQHVCPWATKLH